VTTRPDILDRVQAALDRLAGALYSGGPDDVLAVESELASAVQALPGSALTDLRDDGHVRRRLLDLRLAVRRCEALGAAVGDLSRALQPALAYDRVGRLGARATASSAGEGA
jgi:hypothetical protein